MIFVIITNVTPVQVAQVKQREKSLADIKCSGKTFLKELDRRNIILSQTLQTGKNERSHGNNRNETAKTTETAETSEMKRNHRNKRTRYYY